MTDSAPATQAATAPSSVKLAPLSPAERMRRTRERRKKELFCLTIELRKSEVDALIRAGRLKPEDRASDAAIKNAVYSVLEHWVVSTTPFRATAQQNGAPATPG
jgi:hypothetical protein